MADNRWIQLKEKLGGKGFLSKTAEVRRRILDACVEKYGYRSCLGSITVLEHTSKVAAKFGPVLASDREWLVRKYGGPGSFGGRSAGRSGHSVHERMSVGGSTEPLTFAEFLAFARTMNVLIPGWNADLFERVASRDKFRPVVESMLPQLSAAIASKADRLAARGLAVPPRFQAVPVSASSEPSQEQLMELVRTLFPRFQRERGAR